MTWLLRLLLLVYLIASFAAFITCWLEQGPPPYFDRATSYGDAKLTWQERVLLVVFLPAILLFVWLEDKWPGIKRIWVELYVTIVLGRQATAADHNPVDHSHWDEAP